MGAHEPDDDRSYVDEHLDEFLALSSVLLDVERAKLPPQAGRIFFQMLLDATPPYDGAESPAHPRQTPAERTMDVVFRIFRELRAEPSPVPLEQRLANVYYKDIILGGVVQNLIIVWYNAAIDTRQAPAEAYPYALVWSAISGHALGMPGPYFGSWAYPPPAPILPPDGEPQP